MGRRTKKIKVLVVDDDWETLKDSLYRAEDAGYEFCGVSSFNTDSVLGAVEDCSPAVLLLDLIEAGNEGLEKEPSGIRLFRKLWLIDKWRQLRGSVQIIFFSNDATAENEWLVARARRTDVAGFVAKQKILEADLDGLGLLRYASQKAKRYKHLSIYSDEDWVHKIRQEHGLLCSPNNHRMEAIWEKILAAGMCYEPVLIQGETGTGKELAARAIFEVTQTLEKHEIGKQADPNKRRKVIGARDWFPCNIASTPAEGNLQYVELFGAYRGSADGITDRRVGIFEKADGGTVFLDEIGDAAPLIQVSLLRVLQENKVSPLGSSNEGEQEIDVCFRLVTASNVDLPKKARKDDGSFRSDLYYRLNTIEIVVPPLRERKEDIPILVHEFLDELNSDYDREITIPEDNKEQFFERLKEYHWPGNVRQLKAAIRSSYVMSFGTDLVLSEEVERMLDHDTFGISMSPNEVLDGLERSPKALSTIAKETSRQTAIKVAELWVQKAGRHPNEQESQRYFGCSRETTRRWMTQNGVPSPGGPKKKKS